MSLSDEELMARALLQAEAAAARGEVPVGALIYNPVTGDILAEAGNGPIGAVDPTAHAEILVLREAAKKMNNYRLAGCELFVTLEPCAMCAGAISFARISRLVYGAVDPKGGGVAHGGRFFEQPTCHHGPDVKSGIFAEEAAALLKSFFASRRKS